jgi:hypothetical protein
MKIFVIFLVGIALSAGLSKVSRAQEMPPQPQAVQNNTAENAALAPAVVQPDTPGADGAILAPPSDEIDPNRIAPIIMTAQERAAIVDARQSRGLVRPPTPEELAEGIDGEKPPPTPEEREIRLEGIVYVNANDWTIWLNGQRVTPSALPKEAIDLRVFENYVEMKWFDEYTNQIFPLRIRSHQRFNMDMRIFLPG